VRKRQKEAYLKRQPPMYAPRRCKCGEPDSWKCWHKVKSDELLGERRR